MFTGNKNAAQTSGFQSGFQTGTDIVEGFQNRQIKQEKWQKESQLLEDSIMKSHIQTSSMATLADKAMPQANQEGFQKLYEEQKRQGEEIRKGYGSKLSDMFGGFLSSLFPEDDLGAVQNTFRQSPELAKEMDIDPESIRMYSSTNKADVQQVRSYLGKSMPQFLTMDGSKQEKMINYMMETGLVVSSNNKLVDMNGLGRATGALGTMSAEQKKNVESKNDGLINIARGGKAGDGKKVNAEARKAEIDDAATSVTGVEATDATGQKPSEAQPTGNPGALEDTMNVVQDKTPWDGTKTRQKRPKTDRMVMHRTAGKNFWPGAPERNKDGTYAHMTVAPNGVVYRHADDDNVAAHAVGSNTRSIGVEVVGAYDKKTGKWEPMTPKQQKSVEQLTKFYADKYDLLPEDIYSHIDLNAKTQGEGDMVRDAAKEAIKDRSKGGGNYVADEVKDVAQGAIGGRAKTGKSYAGDGTQRATGADGQPIASSRGQMMDKPYSSGGDIGETGRYQLLRELAGFSDNRTSLSKDLDYVAEKMGGDASFGEVADMYRQIKTRTGRSGGGNTVYSQLHDGNLNKYQAGEYGEVGSEEAMGRFREERDIIDRSKTYGSAQNRQDKDSNAYAEGLDTWDNFAAGDIGPEGITNGAINNALVRERESGITKDKWYKDDKSTMDNYQTSYSAANSILDAMDEMGLENVSTGLVESPKQWLSRFAPGSVMDEDTMEKVLANVDLNTKMGNALATYVRSMSGLAVTDAERKFLSSVMGLDPAVSPEVRYQALTSFSDEMSRTGQEMATRMGEQGAVGSALQGAKRFQRRKHKAYTGVPESAVAQIDGAGSNGAKVQTDNPDRPEKQYKDGVHEVDGKTYEYKTVKGVQKRREVV